jgi:hypothetical protein
MRARRLWLPLAVVLVLLASSVQGQLTTCFCSAMTKSPGMELAAYCTLAPDGLSDPDASYACSCWGNVTTRCVTGAATAQLSSVCARCAARS